MARNFIVPLIAAMALIVGLNEGGGGGYTQLPTCNSTYYGSVVYFQSHLWRCIHATPDHWVIIG